ncbi:hypothetical protein EFW57_04047 [Bacillus velezensis]|nr:hypothetical protein EFW57_04047 [Bacillus velezensis]
MIGAFLNGAYIFSGFYKESLGGFTRGCPLTVLEIDRFT